MCLIIPIKTMVAGDRAETIVFVSIRMTLKIVSTPPRE